jgi:hypothetical protein
LGKYKFNTKTKDVVKKTAGCMEVVGNFTVLGWGVMLLFLGITAITGNLTGGSSDYLIALIAGAWGLKILVELARDFIYANRNRASESETKIIKIRKLQCSKCEHEWSVRQTG